VRIIHPTLVPGLTPESPAAAAAVPPPVLLRAFFPRPADPVAVAVLEPLASKYAAVLAAVEAVTMIVRLGGVHHLETHVKSAQFRRLKLQYEIR